jgi:hypothetical protein
MGDEGLEPPANSARNGRNSEIGGAESGALTARNAGLTCATRTPPNPELAQLVEAWPTLPLHIRAAITALMATSTVPTVPTGPPVSDHPTSTLRSSTRRDS